LVLHLILPDSATAQFRAKHALKAMQKHNSKNCSAAKYEFDRAARLLKVRRLVGLTLMLAVVFILPLLASQAQRLRVPVKISTIAVQSSPGATTISIVADGSLGRAQTWQDAEGYHVVLPNTVAVDSSTMPRGVRIRRLGTSLEILVQTKAGANVNAQIDSNRMQLNVDGKLQPRVVEADRAVRASAEEQLLFEDPRSRTQTAGDSQPFKLSSTAEDLGANPQPFAPNPAPAATPNNNVNPAAIVPNEAGQNTTNDPGPSQIITQPEDESWMASIFSGTSVLVVFSLGLFCLLVSRRLRSRAAVVAFSEAPLVGGQEQAVFYHASLPLPNGNGAAANTSLARIDSGSNGSTHSYVVLLQDCHTSLYGAYLIDH
jgi:hypothetical protein